MSRIPPPSPIERRSGRVSESPLAPPDEWSVHLMLRRRVVLLGRLRLDAARAAAGNPPPRVSALMVTRDRPALARAAVECYRRQTHPARELVIVDDGESDELARHVARLDDPSIRLIRPAGARRTLGELRNLAVAEATGELVAQWDDDDLSDPRRLEVQLAALAALGAEASCLLRWRIWWPAERRLAESAARVWEGSLLAVKAALPAYPPRTRGEDTPVLAELMRRRRLALVDAPELYLYVRHGANRFEAGHFEAHWQRATRRWIGSEYERELAALGERLPLGAHLAAAAGSAR
jgi:glycosyltransferase involved in cell wall biosynthesis